VAEYKQNSLHLKHPDLSVATTCQWRR
jgi:hypothetical protein